MNLRRYRIGDVVVVRATVEGGYDAYPKDERKLIRTELEEPRLGQVVGLTRIQLGEYVPPLWDVQAELRVKAVATVWLVRFGMLNRPVRVLDADVSLSPKACGACGEVWHINGFELPLLRTRQPPWPEDVRKEQAAIMKDAPRDEKGRWTKC